MIRRGLAVHRKMRPRKTSVVCSEHAWEAALACIICVRVDDRGWKLE